MRSYHQRGSPPAPRAMVPRLRRRLRNAHCADGDSMKLIACILIFTALLVAIPAFADEREMGRTWGALNGRSWQSMSETSRLYYAVAIADVGLMGLWSEEARRDFRIPSRSN